MPWTLAEILLATNGKTSGNHALTTIFRAISTDTRSIQQGDLFVALEGEHFNGAAFAAAAIQKGAGGIMVNAGSTAAISKRQNGTAVPVFTVADTLKALGDLAAFRRKCLPKLQVLAITGSCGKTTTKEMTAAIVSKKFVTLKTVGNFNNLVGLPLSLLPLTADHEVAILEMGMNRAGEIKRLTEIAAPDICCIVNISAAHLAGLATIDGVARAKGELFAGSKPSGKLVVNLDDVRIRRQAKAFGDRQQITFATTAAGRRHRPLVRATHVKSRGGDGTLFTLHLGNEKAAVRLTIPGAHNVSNAVAAAAMAHCLNIPLSDIVTGLNSFQACDKRLQIERIGGLRLINDSYNANPSSMHAALMTLQDAGKTRRTVAILGDMLELGAAGTKAHQELGALAAQLKIDFLATVGDFASTVTAGAVNDGMPRQRAKNFSHKEQIPSWLTGLVKAGKIGADDWVLIKGSRGMRMETILNDLRRALDRQRPDSSACQQHDQPGNQRKS